MDNELVLKRENDTLFFRGDIDENTFRKFCAEAQPIASLKSFNFRHTTSVSSSGIRDLVRILSELHRKVLFQECVPSLVMNINLIPELYSAIVLESFIIPAACNTCRKSKDFLFHFDQCFISIDALELLLPQCKTKDCDIELLIDPEAYFFFASV